MISCETDDDCVIVESGGICSSQSVINKDYKWYYDYSNLRNKIHAALPHGVYSCKTTVSYTGVACVENKCRGTRELPQ